jgi:AAA ATPase domain
MDELTNPYRPGAGTPPPALTGRDDLINRFGVAFRRAAAGRPGKSLLMIGLRGAGKTVLLNRFVEIAEQEGFRVGLIEAPEHGHFPSLLASRLRRILLPLSSNVVSTAVTRALRVLKTFTLQLPDGTKVSIDVEALNGVADSGNLADDVTDLLVACGEAARDRGTGIVLAIDELQYLQPDELSALIVAIHRTNQLNLPVILTGAGLPQLRGLAGEAKSYAERLFDFPEIGSLNDEDARTALAVPAEESGSAIEDAALDSMVERSHGYPYFLQEWGYHVWNVAPASPITLDDVDRAAPRVQEQLDENFFRVRLDRLTPREREYLVAMAALGPGPHRSGDIAAQLGVRVESVAPRRSALIAKGIIYSPAHGDTAFTVPLFDDFLQRVVPEL